MNSRMWVYPWDFVDEGFDVVLGRLQGEIGIGGVTMPVACAAARYLRVREVDPRWVVSAGGLCFHPSAGKYGATRCKPVVASEFKKRDPLTEAIERCQTCGLTLFVSVSASRIGRMAEQHPTMATKNAFDARSGESLCLANPDVRAFLCDLLDDLTSARALAGVIVEDFDIAWAEADDARSLSGFRPGADSANADLANAAAAERSLLRVCFCESCLQGAGAAGVDAAAAKRSVARILQKAFDAGPGSGLEANLPAMIADDPPLRDMLSWRRSSIAELYSRCVERCSCPIALHVSSPEEAAVFQSEDATPPTLLITADPLSPPTWLNQLGDTTWEVRFGPAPTWPKPASELVRAFQAFAQAGCRSVELTHYGIIPESMMAALKQAVRFDRRAELEQ